MTVRDRFFAAISHRQPDKVPYNVLFTQEAHRKMAEYTGDAQFDKKIGNCFTVINFDGFDRCRPVRESIVADCFGVEWDRSVDKDIGVVRNRLVTEETLERFAFPDPDAPELYRHADEMIASAGDTVLLGNYGFTMFERAWALMGMEDVLCAMAANKPFINAFFDRILAYNLRVLKNICEYPIDGVWIGDDWGHQGGIIMGAPLWRELIKPRVKALYQYAKAQGKFVFIHSCGNITELLPDLIECGVDGVNPFQPEVIDVYAVKKAYGEKLSFFGGISTQRTLPFASPEETRAETRRLMAHIGLNGGYIASPAHDVPADAKPENIAAMIDVMQNQ